MSGHYRCKTEHTSQRRETDYVEIGFRPFAAESIGWLCRHGQWTIARRANHYRKEQRICAQPEGGERSGGRNGGGVLTAPESGSDYFAYC
jgi:hypothetical protein